MSGRAEAFCSPTLFEVGIGYVVVCRHKGPGRVEAGVFLVDVFCLGVKDAYFETFGADEFREAFLVKLFGGEIPEPKPGEWGRKLVEGAAAYARSLGIAPGSGYKKGSRVFGGIDPAACDETFVFGHDGKPHYVQGPYDTTAQRDRILTLLEAKLGPDGFTFLAVDDGDEDGPDDEAAFDHVVIDSCAVDGDGGGWVDEDVEQFVDDWIEAEFGDEPEPAIIEGGPELAHFARELLKIAEMAAEDLQAEGEPIPQGETYLEQALRREQALWNLAAIHRFAPDTFKGFVAKLSAEQVAQIEAAMEKIGPNFPDGAVVLLISELRVLPHPSGTGNRLLAILSPLEPS